MGMSCLAAGFTLVEKAAKRKRQQETIMRASNRLCSLILLLTWLCAFTGPVRGEDSAEPERPVIDPDYPPRTHDSAQPDPAPAVCAWWESASPKLLGLQFNGVYQYMPSFHSPYQGPHSLSFLNNEGRDTTSTYGVYLGSQLARNLQLYV